MRSVRMKMKPSIAAWTAIILFFYSLASAESLLIVNKSVEETTLSKEDVNLIFLGKKTKWANGQKINVAVLKQGKTHESFLNIYMNKTPSKYASFWKIAIVSGTGFPPKFFQNESDLVKYVAEKQGAIGYISPGAEPGDTKKIKVE